jgi:hypothetical protein
MKVFQKLIKKICGDKMSEREEIAKAVQETAKLGQKGLEITEKASRFLARVFKEPVDEIAGIVTDKLRFIRWKRMVQMADEVNRILEEKKIEDTRAVAPKIALPILEEASLEDDQSLQSLWNHLLANAMNPSFNDEVRYGFVEMIKNITAIEATILNAFYSVLQRENRLTSLSEITNYSLSKEHIIEILKMSPDQYAVSANNLMRMQLLAPAVLKGGAKLGGEPLTIFKGIDAVTLTPLGVKFVEACMK